MADSNAEYPTTIGPDVFIKGHMQFEKGIRLLGRFEGEITSKGNLVAEEGSKMAGEIHAGNIRVDGEVKGNLTADSKVQLSASGRLEGDIQASRLEVAEGAVLSGRCLVGSTNGKDKATPPAPAAAASAAAAQAAQNRPKINPQEFAKK